MSKSVRLAGQDETVALAADFRASERFAANLAQFNNRRRLRSLGGRYYSERSAGHFFEMPRKLLCKCHGPPAALVGDDHRLPRSVQKRKPFSPNRRRAEFRLAREFLRVNERTRSAERHRIPFARRKRTVDAGNGDNRLAVALGHIPHVFSLRRKDRLALVVRLRQRFLFPEIPVSQCRNRLATHNAHSGGNVFGFNAARRRTAENDGGEIIVRFRKRFEKHDARNPLAVGDVALNRLHFIVIAYQCKRFCGYGRRSQNDGKNDYGSLHFKPRIPAILR